MLFWGTEQKHGWDQPASWCVLSHEVSGEVTFLNLSFCCWGIWEIWATPQSDWFFQSHLHPSSSGQESYSCIRFPCWEAEWDTKTHKLVKDCCSYTSSLYFLVVPPAIRLWPDHEYDGKNVNLLASAVRGQRGKWTMSIPCQRQGHCLGGPWSNVFMLVPKLCIQWNSVSSLHWSWGTKFCFHQTVNELLM